MTAGHDAVDEISAAWHRERPDLDTSSIGIVTRIWRIGRLLDRHRDRTLAELGIDASTLDLLSTLRRAGPPYALTPTTIAARTLLTTGAVSQRVAKAEAAGLVARAPSPGDARSLLVALTRRGHDAVDRAVELVLGREQALVDLLPPDDQRELAALLRTFLGRLESSTVSFG